VVQQVEARWTEHQIRSQYVGPSGRCAHLCAATESVEDACIHIRDRHPIRRSVRIALERTEMRTATEERVHVARIFIGIAARQRVYRREQTPALDTKDAVELPAANDAP